MTGIFITFEGSEGSGKSTQIKKIQAYLKSQEREVLFVREPGGVKISEKIRRILLDPKNIQMGSECETLLYMAARAQLVEEVIAPALKAGKIVLSDRFLDSTVVYQGYGSGVDVAIIKKIGAYATQNIKPNLTLVFDIETKKGFARLDRAKDRIEQRALAYHEKVRQGYLSIAQKEPRRVKVIDCDRSREDIHEDVKKYISKLFV